MDDAIQLIDYLPSSYKDKREEEYIKFIWDAFTFNYSNDKYEFANLAFHLLYMSFVSFSIWQIKAVRKKDFKNAMVGFQRATESKILNADTPFKFYEPLKESNIFRFLKLIGCNNDHVGEFSKFVKDRNKIAHPSGDIFFNDKESIDEHIMEILKEVGNIQGHMQPIIQETFSQFLTDNHDPEEWEYSVASDQIVNILIHQNYLSQKDIQMCLDYDISSLSSNADFTNIKELYDAFVTEYKED